MISVTPASRNPTMWCSISGRPETVSNGFGVTSVKGFIRRPSPAANTIAFIRSILRYQ